ncbi:MAG: hypothetical protein ABII22_02015 [Candidatus Micrarchaeota archaeon]
MVKLKKLVRGIEIRFLFASDDYVFIKNSTTIQIQKGNAIT